ncbi:MAG: hypothetical protein A2169_06380 [Deltaproteobacteria bacterium RBG_13_47_9]|nr:MAG: hypothetical protein A2169_06380 [Deltaproteobacteria bacterium RBG_13_47_9]
MKRIEEQTYYEILEISPTATLKEIQRAYERSKETFQSDSVAIYSLFSEEEIEKIQTAIEEAYRVLMEETLRKDYDRSYYQEHSEVKQEKPPELKAISREKKESLSFTELSIEMGEVTYRGKTMKQIRERMGVELKAISAETKISQRVLEWIEEETLEKLPSIVYLKGFLKGYAQFLNLDPQKVVSGYLQFISEKKKK